MEPTKEEPSEARANAAKRKSQITLAKRRVKAFEIAGYLIEREIGRVETL